MADVSGTPTPNDDTAELEAAARSMIATRNASLSVRRKAVADFRAAVTPGVVLALVARLRQAEARIASDLDYSELLTDYKAAMSETSALREALATADRALSVVVVGLDSATVPPLGVIATAASVARHARSVIADAVGRSSRPVDPAGEVREGRGTGLATGHEAATERPSPPASSDRPVAAGVAVPEAPRDEIILHPSTGEPIAYNVRLPTCECDDAPRSEHMEGCPVRAVPEATTEPKP